MRDERLILALAQYLLQKCIGGIALGSEDMFLALARIDQNADFEREIGFAREVANGLRDAVIEKLEIGALQILDEQAPGVADGGEQRDDIDVRREFRLLREGGSGNRKK